MSKAARRRLVNAVAFFAARTNFCGKIKLFKLLYLLDFEHFRRTGRSVTGLDYAAWKFGPVPTRLMEEWELQADDPAGGFPEDLARAVHVKPERVYDHIRQTVVVNDGFEFDDGDFTPLQLELMEGLAHQYHETRSPELIDVTHAQNGAWDRVWQGGNGAYEPINYELSLGDDEPHREAILEAAYEAKAFSRAFA